VLRNVKQPHGGLTRLHSSLTILDWHTFPTPVWSALVVTLGESTHRDTANTESEEDGMKTARKLGLLFCMAILIVTFSSSAKANEFDKLTVFTFSAPVELPGDIVLSPGSYVFKLLDDAGERNIVEILDQQQTEVYAIILTAPAERPRPADKSTVEFYQSTAGAPNALKTWFYPGDNYGQEFVYPRARAAELAKTAKQPVSVSSSNSTSSQAQP
jgi:hypothetical protein